jgi:hydroxymethylpyrimidine/phosphomethylpyrimidine kinase
MRNELISCLSIGSSDSDGAAGIQGDIKTFLAMGAYGTTVVVGVTAQNTCGINARQAIALDVIAAQIESVFDDVPIDAVKVGTTWSVEIIKLIADRLIGFSKPIIFDPVMATASSAPLGGDRDVIPAIIERMFPLATVITPNLKEAQHIAGLHGDVDPQRLAESLGGLGARAVLITDALPDGGDWFFDGSTHSAIRGQRYLTGCDHGAGCAHSSALAVLLASGMDLGAAAVRAHEIVGRAVRYGYERIGKGNHPVNIGAAMERAS